MKKRAFLFTAGFYLILLSCGNTPTEMNTAQPEPEQRAAGQSAVQDDVSQKNAVQVAIGSKDHSTLVAAVKAADLADVLSNTGPFTVFAPTNAAFNKLPAGTVEGLLKPEKLWLMVSPRSWLPYRLPMVLFMLLTRCCFRQ
jgi:uncharacterized surface protein with fasciclin (FAS1) repeats